ncbi:MAG TPA: response regulator [Selenomonadales bacterium]|nr:response regulator [Selenomonadales bacterium]
MTIQFVIIDDDVSIRRIMRNVIEQHGLGTVVGECADGLEAERLIGECRPDIAVVDLLLPGQDGVELIKRLESRSCQASFIMISESRSQPMITQAYQHGIEFYIHKPINVLEIITVINRVKESRKLKQALSLISQATAEYAVGPLAKAPAPSKEEDTSLQRKVIYKVFSDMGILGEVGAKSIYQMIQLLVECKRLNEDMPYQLNEIYQRMAQDAQQDTKTIEQRVRRAIAKALLNLANMGVEDYNNDRFQTYSTALFDFSEVRQEMNWVQGKSPYHGKINVKKFIEGLMFLVTSEQIPRS